MNVERDYYKYLVVSASGKGKTFAARNMNPDTTGFINVENKPLPFKHSFKYHARPKKFAGVLKAFEDYDQNPEITAIVLDSFTTATEKLMEDAKINFKGYDIFNYFNDETRHLLDMIKDAKKEVIVTGIYELLSVEGEFEKRLKVPGKQFEGMVEKEFTVVLYGDSRMKEGKPDYFFKTNEDGTPAKCPPDLLGEGYKFPNDYNTILENTYKFLGLKK